MKKLDGLLDTLIAAKVEHKRKAVFHYSSYWGTWSRRILRPGEDPMYPGTYVEINLTPISGYNDWDQHVAPIIFRMHGTSPDLRDRDEVELPKEVRQRMVENLGEDVTEFILTEDFLPQIDLQKISTWSIKRGGGGASLREILRGGE